MKSVALLQLITLGYMFRPLPGRQQANNASDNQPTPLIKCVNLCHHRCSKLKSSIQLPANVLLLLLQLLLLLSLLLDP